MSRRRGLTGAIALLALVLSACSGIPSSGGVNEGGPVAVPDASDIQYLPSGPRDGATQSDILNGFLEASSSPQNDFAIAREYLSPEARDTWDPSVLTLIDTGARDVTSGENTMTVSVSAQALLDASGRYVEQAEPTRFDFPFTFAQVSGQWRITSLPQGIVIDRSTFTQVFRQTSLYFLTSDLETLVPDVRWFPSRAATTTRVTKALLAGPSSWLAQSGAVVSAFPTGTELVADTVPIQSGTAIVDLSGANLVERPGVTRLMRVQLYASLIQVPGVSNVDMRILGGGIAPADVGAQMREMIPTVDARAVLIKDGRVGYASSTTPSRIGALRTTPPDASTTGVTVADDASQMAFLSGVGVQVASPLSTRVVDDRGGLIVPGLDSRGYVWSVPRGEPGAVLVTSPAGDRRAVETPWKDASDIVALRIAPDGSRLVALYVAAGTTHLVVAGIGRDPEGTPIVVGGFIDLTPPVGSPVDAVWLDAVTVAAVGVDDFGIGHVISGVVGGRSTTYAATGTPVSLAGGANSTQLRVRTTDDTVLIARYTGAWAVESQGVQVLGTIQ